jgi:hypothetical protein
VTKLDRLWQALEAVPDLAATNLEWKARLGDDYGFAATFLVSRNEVGGSYPCPVHGNHGHRHRIVSDGDDDYTGICEFCGEVSHGRDDVYIYAVNTSRLGKAVAAAFKLQVVEGEVAGVAKTFRVGTYVPKIGCRIPVFLTLQCRRDAFQKATDRVAAIEKKSFILMAPTSRLFQPESETALRSASAHFIALNEVVEVNRRKQLASVATIEQAIGRLAKRPRGRRKLSAAEYRRYERLWSGWETIRGKGGMTMPEYCEEKDVTLKKLESMGRHVRRARRQNLAAG